MKLDLLAFAAHPDDVEISCSGTIIKHIQMGYKVGVIDLTQGELGTRGTYKTRKEESIKASQILGIHQRENLKMEDGFFEPSEINKRKISCNDGIVVNQSEISLNKNSARTLKFKKWNKALRGKGPIYSTHSGTNLKIDTFGEEKSITIDRAF